MTDYLIEACVDTIAGALAAQQGGAKRVELCADLIVGGTTPSAGTIQLAVSQLAIPIHVMIRPRADDFVYDEYDLSVMAHDIRYTKETGAAGVVFGLLQPDGTIDTAATRRLTELARPLSVTFHRAFDLVTDPFTALDTLIELGIDRLLTSGQEATALEGSNLIAGLIRRAANRIVVMPGGGINEHTIARIAQSTGAQELHMSGRATVESPMQVRNPRVLVGGAPPPSEHSRQVTSSARIRACIAALSHLSNT